jgi:hypothetical protein
MRRKCLLFVYAMFTTLMSNPICDDVVIEKYKELTFNFKIEECFDKYSVYTLNIVDKNGKVIYDGDGNEFEVNTKTHVFNSVKDTTLVLLILNDRPLKTKFKVLKIHKGKILIDSNIVYPTHSFESYTEKDESINICGIYNYNEYGGIYEPCRCWGIKGVNLFVIDNSYSCNDYNARIAGKLFLDTK